MIKDCVSSHNPDSHDTKSETFISVSLSIIVFIGKYLSSINHFFHPVLFDETDPDWPGKGQFPVPRITSPCSVVRMLWRISQDIINQTPTLVIIGWVSGSLA